MTHINIGEGKYHDDRYPHETEIYLINGASILVHLHQEDYKILFDLFCPRHKQGTGHVRPEPNRPDISSKTRLKFHSRNAWPTIIQFVCLKRDQNNGIRKTRLVLPVEHIVGFAESGANII